MHLYADSSLALESNIAKYHSAFAMFLTLKFKVPKVVPPTIEIDTIWKSYLIRPALYKQLCTQLVGELVPHTFHSAVPVDAVEYTLQVWQSYFNQSFQNSIQVPIECFHNM